MMVKMKFDKNIETDILPTIMNAQLADALGLHPITIDSWTNRLEKLLIHESDVINHIINSPEYKAKPFLKWIGGKGRFAKKFHEFFPSSKQFDSRINTYFEPFLGGGAIFFELHPSMAVLSDVNPELVNTYQVVKTQPKALIRLLKVHQKKNNERYYYDSIRPLDVNELSKTERAARFIYLNRTSFNGMHRVNRKGEFNVPYGHYKNPRICDEENIMNVSKRLKKVDIQCFSYEQILKHAKKGDFIYLDPPYYPLDKRTANFTKYTKDSFLDEDHVKMRDFFVQLHMKGCLVMMSNSDVPFIQELYTKDKIGFNVNMQIVYSRRFVAAKGKGRKEVGELLIRNYE